MVSKSSFNTFSLVHEDGNYFLRNDRIMACFYFNPKDKLEMNFKIVANLEVERNKELQVLDILEKAYHHQTLNVNRIDATIRYMWRSLTEVKFTEDSSSYRESHAHSNNHKNRATGGGGDDTTIFNGMNRFSSSNISFNNAVAKKHRRPGSGGSFMNTTTSNNHNDDEVEGGRGDDDIEMSIVARTSAAAATNPVLFTDGQVNLKNDTSSFL
jgi:hypothetical protein